MIDLEDLFEAIQKSFDRDDFVKLTFSKPIRKSEELKNVYVRLIYIKRKPNLSFTYRYKTNDQVKNYPFEKAKKYIRELLSDSFRLATFFSLKEDLLVFVSKKRTLSYRKNPPSFKNKPPEVHDKLKVKYVQNTSFLKDLKILDEKGNIISKMADKYRQINKFLEIIEVQLKSVILPKKIQIVDMGSGKGYLTFALYDYLVNQKGLNVEITGIELRQNLVDFCNTIAKKHHFHNLKFKAKSIEEYDYNQIDILIALHACDIATDFAIAKGIKADASLIICAPCCHKQIRQQLKGKEFNNSILKYGIFKERMFEMVTDTIRSLILEQNQYKTQVFEFISSDHTAKNIMLIGGKYSKKIDKTQNFQSKIDTIKQEFGIEYHELERLIKT
ncbi:MAG: class I SAM-dependent methyltransferase [Flavobacteriales bacterium]